MRGHADADLRIAGVALQQPIEQPQESIHIMDETPLAASHRLTPEAAIAVEYRQMREADARVLCRRYDPFRHLREVGIGPALGIVVQVVKLADRGVARLEHLDVDLRRDRLHLIGAELTDESIHHLPPGPEAVAAGAGLPGLFRQSGHGALKGMRMEIGHSRHDRPAKARRSSRPVMRRSIRNNVQQRAVGPDLEQDVVGPAIGQ